MAHTVAGAIYGAAPILGYSVLAPHECIGKCSAKTATGKKRMSERRRGAEGGG